MHRYNVEPKCRIGKSNCAEDWFKGPNVVGRFVPKAPLCLEAISSIPEKHDNAGELRQAQIILSTVLLPPMPQAATDERPTQRPSRAASSAAHGLYFFFTISLPNFVVLRTRTSALRENFTFSLPFPYQN
jgi:hypothetical protein